MTSELVPAAIGNTVITGASSGVGEAIALRLAARGTPVFAIGRNEDRLTALSRRAAGIHVFSADVRQPKQLEAVYATIEREHGPIEALVNNAAWNRSREFATLDLESIDEIIDTNLKGTLYATRLVLPYMLARKRGRIVNIASVAGTRGIPTEAAYCASKHGMVGFADSLAQELIPHGILVSTLCPGGIDTPWWRGEDNKYGGDITQLIKPDEMAEVVEFVLTQPQRTLWKRLVFFPTIEWH